ncbi:MAG: hypothetical protein HYZ72_01070 [Deltaproteobacteria bacterium]|nr:hypothetical protein [Deltaproteobacteria bacterium]
MPQLFLPVFPGGVTEISPRLAVSKENGTVTYFHGLLPVFSHDEGDVRTFQMITAQFCCGGSAREVDIIRTFGVSPMSVKRAVKKYRELGPAGFYAPRKTRGSAVLTAPVVAEAQGLLDEGNDVADVAAQLGIKQNTLSKAVKAGRLHVAKKNNASPIRTPR